MKKLLVVIGISFLCVLFFGCPYESNVPIAKPVEKVDQNLIGVWNEEHYEINIAKLDKHTYIYQAKNKYTNEQLDTLAFYTSTINGITFLNIFNYKRNSSPDKYALYKLEFKESNEIRLYPITDDIKEAFEESDSLKKFIFNTMSRPGFFEGPLLLTRVKK